MNWFIYQRVYLDFTTFKYLGEKLTHSTDVDVVTVQPSLWSRGTGQDSDLSGAAPAAKCHQ